MFSSTTIRLKHLKWEEANINLYWETLEKLLEQNFVIWDNPENIQVLASTIPQAFLQAAELSVPTKEVELPNFKVKKSLEWRKAEQVANKAEKVWRMNGKPRNEDNKLLMNKKVARSNLRAAVQKHNAAVSIK